MNEQEIREDEWADGYNQQVADYAAKKAVPPTVWRTKSNEWKAGYAYGEMEVRKSHDD